MGHQTPSDLEAVLAATDRVWHLAQHHVFPGEAEFLLDQPNLTLEGPSFRVEFRLQQDALGWDNELAQTMIALRFGLPGRPLPDAPWTLYVHGDWRERTDRLARRGPLSARRLRKALSPKRRSPDDQYRDAAKNDDMYVMERTPRDDITAQVCLFVLQTEVSRDADGALFGWLVDYLTKHFKLPAAERREFATAMILHMLEYKWYAEDPRAWRKYVAGVQRGLRRRALTSRASDRLDVLQDGRDMENQLIGRIDRSRRGELFDGDQDEAADGGRRSAAIASWLGPYDPDGNAYTVDEATERTGVRRSTLYSRIDRGHVVAETDAKGRKVIPRSEVERLTKTPSLSAVVRIVAAARETSESTARKYAFRLRRQGWSLEEILRKWGS